jgi:hypothetical protein
LKRSQSIHALLLRLANAGAFMVIGKLRCGRLAQERSTHLEDIVKNWT